MSRRIYAAMKARLPEWRDDDALGVYSAIIGFPALRDRFGFLNRFSRFRLVEDAEEFPRRDCRTGLADLMDARAAEVLALLRAGDRQGYIFLSGGVDSTALSVALLRAADGDLSNLHVVWNEAAAWENPPFLELLGGTGIDMIECRAVDVDTLQAQILHEGGYALTGWCADQLFGSVINSGWPEWYLRDWRDWLREFSEIGADRAITQYEAAFDSYDLRVERFGQFSWFLNFATKYNIVRCGDILFSGERTGRMVSFYDTPGFQSWSVSNFDRLHDHPQSDPAFYKIDLKRYIYEFDRNADYLARKGKIGSWANPRFGRGRGVNTPRYCVLEAPDRAVIQIHHREVRPADYGRIQALMARNILRLYRKTDDD